ncbi:hypothetical protein Tco_0655140 [Tanacetum coccineum]|uniref:Uncharacterized protein n=1 Tax=Tanacetum coccineum TaxID=301880 RepID=A0ABQ4X575_9ASTR
MGNNPLWTTTGFSSTTFYEQQDYLHPGLKDGRISYKEFQSTMKAGTEWKKASLGTLVSGFVILTPEPSLANNGCNGYEYDAIVIAVPKKKNIALQGNLIFLQLIQQERKISRCLFAQWRAFEMTNAGFTV